MTPPPESLSARTIVPPSRSSTGHGEASPYGREYWRSLAEREGLLGAGPEFPEGAEELTSVDRRDFFRLLGASLALAGAGGLSSCTRPPATKVVPYHRVPPELTPGNALHFATAMPLGGVATGLLVTSREGRPVKVEGNPEHPDSLGAAGILEQAHLLGLYDPHRARQLKQRGSPVGKEHLLEALTMRAARLQERRGEGLYLLLEPTSSPLLQSLRERLLRRFPKARVFATSPLSEANRAEGARIAFGRPLQPRQDFRGAKVVLSLDEDFLEPRGQKLSYARHFFETREPGAGMSRLYVVEPSLTITGMSADHRLPARGSDVQRLAYALVRRLTGLGVAPALEPLSQAAKSFAATPGKAHRFIDAAGADLARAKEGAMLLAGPRQPPAVHALAAAVNYALGSARGSSPLVRYLSPPAEVETGPSALRELAADLRAGRADTLLVTAANPAYAGFADLELGRLFREVPESFYLSLYEDETAPSCSFFVPALHPLESWGDGRASDGTVSLIQPLVEPLAPGFSEAELLSALIGAPAPTYQLLREHWRAAREDFERSWEEWLREGFIQGTAAEASAPEPKLERVAEAMREAAIRPEEGGLEVAFAGDYKVHDGRFANNPWLQELPDPITKLSWDNAALLSPRTAEELGLETGELVRLSYRGRSVEAAVCLAIGHAEGTVTLPLGYGRSGAERTAKGAGFDAYLLRPSDAPWFGYGLSVERLGRRRELAITQEHWGMEQRPLALELALGELGKAEERLSKLRGAEATLHQPVDYSGEPYRWAMAVDLNRCTGCSACVVACQAENNIPVVGRDNVRKSREMHWLRVDRYFEGEPDSPRAIAQPLACVHCEAAPCEYVCPVNATVHSDEGLNEMVYNRCIGTRYCSNNCPYKVRRFNYLHYNREKSPTERLAMNPDVTVRARGVMEKCTYCVQRIERKRIEARVEGRSIRDGELRTACQQACPSQAIVFGSLNDPTSRVSELHRDGRRFDLLHELGTRPRTAYLVRVRNPNPELG
ncbi:MAG: TAT-variant-translocated molybdopterin oxidoreductase [Myxococcales bacterium]|nr:TAT-variant-translocated molybdopterin oxidoreductase [Myxococcales bacterium]